MHEVLSKGVASPTPLPPAPHGARSTLRDKGPGSHSSIPPPSLCSWPPWDPPSPCTPPHLAVVAEGAVGLRVAAAGAAAPAEREGAAAGGGPHVGGRWRQHLHHLRLHHLHGGLRLGPPAAAGGHQVLEGLCGERDRAETGCGGAQKGRSQPAPALPTALTALLHGHPQAEVLLLQLLVALLQVADVLDGFPQDRRLVQLPETMGGGSAPLPAAPSSPPAPAPFAPPSPITAHPPWPRCPPPGP